MKKETSETIAMNAGISDDFLENAETEQNIPKFDAGYKQELSKPEPFLHFLQKYVKAEWSVGLGPEQISLCDREYVLQDYQKRSADLVYRIRFKTQTLYVYLIMELQSKVDFTMPFRLLTLMFGLLLKIFLETPEAERERRDFRLPVVLPVLFYNGKNKWSAETEFRKYMDGAEYFGEYGLNFKYYLVDLSQIKNDDILNTNTLIDNILALDKNRKSEKLTDILDLVIKRMDTLGESDRVSFQKWLENVLLASTRGSNQETVRKIIEMIRSGKGGSKMIHGIQVIIQGEYDRGVAEGEIRGEARGKVRVLLSQICKKLVKGKSPEVIAEELEEDISVISPIIEAAGKYAPDYDEERIYQEIAGDTALENTSETEA